VIGITDLDPLEYDLIFERFLNPGRISMPDIDTDFEDTYREKVIEYIVNRYGKDNVAHIGTYMSLAAKAAFKDVARVMGIKFDQANKLTTLITEKTVALSVEKNKDLQDAIKADGRIQKIIEVATAIEGTVRQTGVHACGMIIAPAPVVQFTPIQYPPKTGSRTLRDETRIVSQYEGPIVEGIGLLKMDILGLRNLSIIKHTAKILQAKAKQKWEVLSPLIERILSHMEFRPPLDDALAYAPFAKGDTSGIFQFESDGMRAWLMKLKPNCFDDLIAMVSLYRPWPMEFIPHYIDRKFGIEKVTYGDSELNATLTQKYGEAIAQEEEQKLAEDLSPFMAATYGIAVYQEQLMRLVQAMAWFSMAEADNLRKWVGKKIREVIEKIKIEFIRKSWEYRAYKPETAIWIYEKMIEPAADYSFNKSHAACYAYISYQTAYLKAHYPTEFHAALLRSVEQEPDKLAGFIQEVQLQWIAICPPRVNSSFEHIAAVDDHVEIGFLWIKWVGTEVAQTIERERTTSGHFSSLSDFLTRCGSVLNKKSLDSLAKSWALDQRGSREQLVAAIPQMIERCKQQQTAQWWLFDGWWLFGIVDFPLPMTPVTDILYPLRMEKEVFNCPLSRHAFDGLYKRCRAKYNFITVVNVENYGEFRICGIVLGMSKGMRGWRFLKIEDITGQMEFYFMDKVDLEPFDIVYITGYKGQRFPKADCIRVLSLPKLIEQAKKSGLYDENDTIAAVRRARKGENGVSVVNVVKEQMIEDTANGGDALDASSASSNDDNDHDDSIASWDNQEEFVWEVQSESSVEDLPTVFTLPDDVTILQKIAIIIKANPGTVRVVLGTMERSVSERGLEMVREIMR
jgi:DNA polymerase III subunit alpha